MTTPIRDPARLLFLDRLTHLYNWWFMAQYLKERFPVLAAQKVPLSVVLLDLDNFKRVNESYGRLAGDVVLRQIALRLHEGRRRGGYAVRYAGDEFVVFLEGTGVEPATAVAEAIRDRVTNQPIVIPHTAGGISVTASLGVATFPEEVGTASGLIDKARRALALSKRLGRNRASRDVGERLPTEKEALDRFHRPTLLGRERDLDVCRRLFEKARAGGNRFMLVEGEHGAGKSRFLAELPGMLRLLSLPFIQGGCLAQSQTVPYSALTPCLQEYFDRSPETIAPIVARLSGPERGALGSILAVLRPTGGGEEPLSDPERRALLFQGMVDLLALVSEGTPLVILLENFQWADEASLEILLQLLSREDGRLVVCAAATAGPQEESRPGIPMRALAQLLPYFQASPQFHRLTLAPLTPAQVSDMAADILRHPIPERFQQQLFQVSRGIPLLVEETLKGLIMRGTLKEEEGAWNFDQVTPEDFPATGDEALARRLENLDPDTLEVLSEASVIGSDVDLPVLAEVLGQDPGETLDIVERGRHQGLFEQIDPVADAGAIRFASDRLREVVYEGLDEPRRRQSHRKVANVYERLAGPDPGEALGPLTYHFERSDDPGKAGFYRQKLAALRDWLFSATEVVRRGGPGKGGGGEGAEGGGGSGGGREAGTVKVRIPEALQPFDEDALPVAVQFVKTLTLACKNARVFPEGSQLVREELEATSAALFRLLESLEGVTLAEHRGALLANGRALEGKALAALAQDLLRFYREHGIRSITFVRGVIEDEVQGLVRLLSGPAQRILPEISPWEKALESRGILHVGVFPAMYLTTTRQAAAPAASETALDDEGMRLSAEVFRSLAGAVDNLRLYPAENELNVAIQERLEHQAQALLDRIPAVTLALAEDSIVINGVRANPKWFGITGPLLHRLLQESGLISVTLTRGVTRDELRVFLAQLAQLATDDPMSPVTLVRLLEEQGITTIQVGSRFYTPARASLTGDRRQGEGAGGAPGQEAAAGTAVAGVRERGEEDRLFQQVAQWLDSPSAALEVREEEIPAAIDTWLGARRTDLADRLWERIMAGLADPLEGTRQRSAGSLTLLLKGANPRTRAWLREQSFEPLEQALRKEMSPRVFQWQVRAAIEAVKLILSDGDLAHLAGLAAALGTGQAERPDQKKLLPLATSGVEALGAAGAFAPLGVALAASDPQRREQARAILAALGEGALPFVAGLLAQEDDADVRKVAATLLRSNPGTALRLLVPRLRPPTLGEVSHRIVTVLDVIAPELGPDFFFLLAHPDVLVRAEFAGVVARVPRAAALRFLERALGERDPGVLLGALECVRGAQATELLDVILRLALRPTAVEVLKAACLCLGQLKDERAVGPLVGILQRRPRFLGLVKGLPDTVRAASARALGELAFPEAQEALRAVHKDPSMAVRSTARLALSRLRQGRESR